MAVIHCRLGIMKTHLQSITINYPRSANFVQSTLYDEGKLHAKPNYNQLPAKHNFRRRIITTNYIESSKWFKKVQNCLAGTYGNLAGALNWPPTFDR